jgi:hypothetical protein
LIFQGTILLAMAMLFEPFEFQSAKGFIYQHNGAASGVLVQIDPAFDRVAESWRSMPPPTWVADPGWWKEYVAGIIDASPFIVRIVTDQMAIRTRFCLQSVKAAAVRNGPLGFRGYTILLNGAMDTAEVSAALEEGFQKYMRMATNPLERATARLERACLE